MGCFSFKCKVTGKPALSTSFDGSPVHLFLLKNGEAIEYMHGNYDSYGRVFTKDGMTKSPPESIEWKMEWGDVCDLMFDSNRSNGIALILDPHWKQGDPYPTERSEDDPDQGWGNQDIFKYIENPVHDFNFDF